MNQKIVIRTPNHLGDCIMALPMISEAQEAYPGASITLLTPVHLAQIFAPNPSVDEIITVPSQYVHGLIAVMKIKEMIAHKEFDIGYILPPSFGAAASFKLAGVKERIGYIADGRRLLLTKPLPLPAPLNEQHRSELYFNLLRRGSGAGLEFVRPKLFLNDQDVQNGTQLLGGFEIDEDEEFAVVAFRAVAESRRWGSSNYVELIKQMVATYGIRVVLTGTEEDRKAGDELAEAAGTKFVKNFAGKTSIREAASIFSLAKFFVGNDSGPAHLAAAVGTPIVVLSGADDPKSTSPMAARKRLLYLSGLECISCVKNKCPLKGDNNMQCMKGITVPMVMDEIAALLAEVA